MTKESLIRLQRIYSFLLSIVIVIAGICLIVACIGIYNSGDKPFTREAVSNAFSSIAIPVYLCLIMTIIGFIWDLITPLNIKETVTEKPYGHILHRLRLKKDVGQCNDDLKNAIKEQQMKRKIITIIRIVVLTASSAVFLLYGTNLDNFHQSEITDSMIKAMYVLVPCLTVSFCYTLFSIIYNEKSIQKEIELLKQAADVNNSATDVTSNPHLSTKNLNIIRLVVLIVGVAILIYGFVTGGTNDVLTKAINICTECVGLG